MALLIQYERFRPAQLERFRAHQRTCFRVLEDAAGTLKSGVREDEVARELRRAFGRAGARGYFHVPVALFGTRTAYPGDWGAFEAISTGRRLEEGDAVILDASPIFDGYKVDGSLSLRFGENPTFDQADRELATLRGMILAGVGEVASFRELAWRIDDHIRERGWENCHRKHIGAVLGHRVTYAPQYPLRLPKVWGLAPRQVGWFLFQSFLASWGLPARTPNWNATRQCTTPPTEGLWAMEPHIAKDGVGVKFEEILVLDRDGPRWLDDDLPHTRRWAASGISA